MPVASRTVWVASRSEGRVCPHPTGATGPQRMFIYAFVAARTFSFQILKQVEFVDEVAEINTRPPQKHFRCKYLGIELHIIH